MTVLTEAKWQEFEENGYVRLGKMPAETLQALQDGIDNIMLGKANIDYDRLTMQLDSDTGVYEDAGEMSHGHKGSTLNYRKIENLEFDPTFLSYMQDDSSREACARLYGADTPVGCFRAMFMNKPANKGTFLPFHQDRWTRLDRDPLLTVYTALDPATKENGCVQVIPGSHKVGLINPSHPSGFLTPAQAEEWCPPEKVVYLEMEPGEVTLLHNYLLHGSDKNHSAQSRRAFSVCLMDGNTIDVNSGKLATQSIIFGQGALDPNKVSLAASA